MRGLVYTMYIFSNIAEIYPVDASSNDPVVATKNVLINYQSPLGGKIMPTGSLCCVGSASERWVVSQPEPFSPVPTAVQLGQDKTTAMSSAAPARLTLVPTGQMGFI